MRKFVYMSVLFLILLGIIGCSTGEESLQNNSEDNIIEIVEKIETADWKLAKHAIDYDSYINEMNGFFSEAYDTEKHQRRIFQIPMDARELTEEQRKELKKQSNIKDINISISKIYEGQFKNVFTKIEVHTTDELNTNLIRKYIIIKEDNEWKVAGIEEVNPKNVVINEKDWVHAFVIK